jgi:N4-(beta-N-acetylglucosaminyl)-L-asparaginase
MKRRDFLKNTAIVTAATALVSCDIKTEIRTGSKLQNGGLPIVISTWNHGIAANEAAMEIIVNGGRALDAVEAGVRVPESDPEMMSVGYGGLPDRDGHVTLDACIMDETGNCGAVSYLEHIKNPISVARKVMEDTPHVMLSGKGAYDFAIEKGFKKENLLTEKAEKRWKEWLKESKYETIVNIENHDTIGLLAIDKKGDISGACTTSGLAWKVHGRVGDSPIIGAGMYVDNEVGGACATGVGEMVMKTLGTFLIVELMRQGRNPQEACEEAVNRIIAKQEYKDMQVGYLAIDKEGNYGAYAIHPGFNYALHLDGENNMHASESYV